MSKNKKLSSILAESYTVYFEFIGIIISWLLIAYLFFNDFWKIIGIIISWLLIAYLFFNAFWTIIVIIIGVFHASYRAYQHVKNNN